MALFSTRSKPKGPMLSNLEKHQINLSGISINLNMPVSNAQPYNDRVNQVSMNIYDKSIYHSSVHDDPCTPLKIGLVGSAWNYQGFSFFDSECFGQINLSINLVYMPEFSSLFRPRRFECAMERYIYLSYLYATPGLCRLDFARQTIAKTNWAKFTCRSDEDEMSAFQTVWQTPLTDDHLISVRFNQSGNFKRSGLKASYSDLMESIMNSLTIEWPQDILRQKADIEKNNPHESFPENLPPYQYEYFEPQDELDVIRQVSAFHNHDSSIPENIFSNKVKDIMEAEKKKKETIHQQILDNHMRFEALEDEDLKKFNSQKNNA